MNNNKNNKNSKTQINLPITWDDTTVDYTVSDFGGNFSTVATDTPDGSNNYVLKSIKRSGASPWAGTTLSTTNGLSTKIPFVNGSTVISARIYAPNYGMVIKLKAEDKDDPTKSVETEAITRVALGWETLHFDFANQTSGTAAIDFSYNYNTLSIFYDYGKVDGNVFYLDNVYFGQSTYNVTFSVDMSTYTGLTASDIVYLNGSFNLGPGTIMWCGDCAPMTDAGNGIWEVTVPLDDGFYEYKFTINGWNIQEDLSNTNSSCTVTTNLNKTLNIFINRPLTVSGADIILDTVPWEGCPTINGCTDSTACNYDPTATIDDQSCILPDGCTDPNACNYNSTALCDDGSCILPDGCTNPNACNYNSTALCDDESCILPDGCTDPNACNYDSSAQCDDGSCNGLLGCTNSAACNYNPNATCDDGTCILPDGCTDPNACNYDSSAQCDDGSCLQHTFFINGNCSNTNWNLITGIAAAAAITAGIVLSSKKKKENEE